MGQRVEFIDLAKGICISLVVLLHVYGDLSGTAIQIMNLFRMPLYFVLSGLFFKPYDGLLSFLKKKTNKLLVPFFFTFFFIIVPSTLLLNIKNGIEPTFENLFWGGEGKCSLGIDGAAWFLICLYAINFCFYLIYIVTKTNLTGIIMLSLLCGAAGYTLNYYDIYLPLWFDSALTAVPFFLMGYALRSKSDFLYRQISTADWFICVFAFMTLLGIHQFNEWQHTGTISYGSNTYDIGMCSLYIGGAAGTCLILIVSKYIKRLPLISYIGRYSIVVLLTHLLYLFIIRNILYQMEIPQENIPLNIIVFIFLILIEVPTIKFCIKYLPYFFAQKDLWK